MKLTNDERINIMRDAGVIMSAAYRSGLATRPEEKKKRCVKLTPLERVRRWQKKNSVKHLDDMRHRMRKARAENRRNGISSLGKPYRYGKNRLKYSPV